MRLLFFGAIGWEIHLRVGAMIRKKAKGKRVSKTAPKTSERKKGEAARKDNRRELDPVGTWKEVAMLVESHATAMAEAVIEEGEKGQVSPVKFLFEMAKIGPPLEGTQTTEEESLAKTLLRTLNIPLTPVAADQSEAENTMVIPANASALEDEEKGERTSGSPGKVGG